MTRWIAAVILAAACGTAAAQPLSICMGRSEQERAIDDAVNADTEGASQWSFWWGFSYVGAGMAAIFAATLLPDHWMSDRTRAGLFVTAAKAAVGALGRGLFPLRIPYERRCLDEYRQPPGTQRERLARAIHAEKKTFYLTLFGGLAVNTAGLLYLGLERDDWRTGTITFVSGSAVAALTLWTMPHRAWSLNIVPTPTGVALVGQF